MECELHDSDGTHRAFVRSECRNYDGIQRVTFLAPHRWPMLIKKIPRSVGRSCALKPAHECQYSRCGKRNANECDKPAVAPKVFHVLPTAITPPGGGSKRHITKYIRASDTCERTRQRSRDRHSG